MEKVNKVVVLGGKSVEITPDRPLTDAEKRELEFRKAEEEKQAQDRRNSRSAVRPDLPSVPADVAERVESLARLVADLAADVRDRAEVKE